MSILRYLKINKKFIELIFYRGLGSGLGMLIYVFVLSFFGNYFAIAHSGFVTSYQVGQAGCTFERNLNSTSAMKTFLQSIYLRFIFSFFWLLILFLVFEIDLYILCFIGFFISFLYLIHFDRHTEFIKKSSFILSMVPVVTIILVSLLFYFFPFSLKSIRLVDTQISIPVILVTLVGTFAIGFYINKKNKFFIFEILYSSVPIFILSFLVKNQITEIMTFYLIIFYKVLEFLYAGCYFALTGTKKIEGVLKNFFLAKKYYTILLIFIILIIIIFKIDESPSIFLVLWIFLFRISSFLLLSYKVFISSCYIAYSILLIYFSSYINDFFFIFSLFIPNTVILIFQKKINFKNFSEMKL